MPLRIGFDMDGVLADFALAFHEVDLRLFGPGASLSAPQPEKEEEAQSSPDGGSTGENGRAAAPDADADGEATVNPDPGSPSPRELRRRRDVIWKSIHSTPNFWGTLKPTEAGVVARIHEMTLRHKWEVFFITQRPATKGDTVQRQTQHWLVHQGFDLPSVLVLGGSRGAAAGALRLDYHIDDSAQNCLDVISDSRAKPILIIPDNNGSTIASARSLGIGTAGSIGECLDILEKATTSRAQPGLLARIASMVGWK
jgi:hypothetical protein